MEGEAGETEARGMEPSEPERPMFDESEEEGFGWRRLQVWGAVAIIAVAILRMALQRTIDPFNLAPVGIFLLGLLLLALVPRVGSIYLAVFAVASGVFGYPELSFSLLHPEAPADFLTSLLAVVGVVLMLVSAVPSFRLGKGPSKRSGGAVWLAFFIVLLLLGGAGWSFAASRDISGQAAATSDVLVVSDGFEFVPEKLAAEGGVVSVHLDNADAFSHTFTIDELNVDLFVAGKTSERVEFSAPPGDYVFYCVPHPWMEGILTIE